MVKAILFDLDGTLVSTASEHRYLLVGQVLDELKEGCVPDKRQIDLFWFGTNREDIIRDHFKVDPERFWQIFKKYDTEELRRPFTAVYHDCDVLREIKERGYRTGIVTGASQNIATFEISLLGAHYFDVVIHARPSAGIQPKPHPDGIEKCLVQLGIDKNDALFVGNAEEDVLAARNAHVLDVLILRGEHVPQIRASWTIDSLYDLRSLMR